MGKTKYSKDDPEESSKIFDASIALIGSQDAPDIIDPRCTQSKGRPNTR